MTAALRLVHDDDPQEPRPELLGLWAVFMRANGHSEATIALYLRTVRALMRQAGVEHDLDLTRDHVIAFLGRDVKPWTRLTYWKAISSWCRWLRDFDHADVDLLRGMPRPRTPEPMATPRPEHVTVWTPEEATNIEVAPEDLADVAAKITETLALASVRLADIRARGE